ncbi:TetR/AcrR family transcriptional regulator [Actinosynnema pretiosum]|uniref:TetR/AcrR family transcriptional regulator n=1 Tax=Actinosynnema pretiosum TaxID=42197 RepID=UPI001E31F862|nr:TetR/AcrR family transcriptional regulator [Actinosynnema pretiosum]
MPQPEASPQVARRPQRVVGRRNFDALLVAAREVFAAHGVGGSLEEVARRAGAGIGALHRNFPNRQVLFGTVHADELDGHEPWEALVVWLRQLVACSAAKKALYEALNVDSPMVAGYVERVHRAGEPLLESAAGGRGARRRELRRRAPAGQRVGGGNRRDDAQRDRVLAMALDGVRRERSSSPRPAPARHVAVARRGVVERVNDRPVAQRRRGQVPVGAHRHGGERQVAGERAAHAPTAHAPAADDPVGAQGFSALREADQGWFRSTGGVPPVGRARVGGGVPPQAGGRTRAGRC